MKDYPLVVRILMLIGFFLVASFALKLIVPLIGLAFKIAIPLLIAIFVVNWLTRRRQPRRYY